jgi:predicted nucleic acid-binding protein
MSVPSASDADDGLANGVTFVDASALVSLADRDDASHAAAVAAYRDLVANGYRLFTTDLALAAAHELLIAALGRGVARLWLSRCRIPVYFVTAADLAAAREMILAPTGAPNAPLLDAIHLAVLDRLGVTDVFAVDRGFLRMLG